jgi:Ca2+-binding EF-hand superfamily protein
MEKTKEEFIAFVHQAVNDKKSSSYAELYQFLVACFVRADTNLDGRVYLEMFDSLIEEAAALPRLYGYAPKAEALYPSAALRKSARAKMFAGMDTDKNGYITLEEWVKYATTHIAGKVASHLPKDYLGGTSDTVTKEEFLDFIKKAVNKGTEEYQQLYFFLLKCFQEGDVNRTGAIDLVAFDKLIEAAAAAPRRFGLAPKTSDLFKTDAERIAKRREYFTVMDKDKNGQISFNEWLDYAYKHILGKVAAL